VLYGAFIGLINLINYWMDNTAYATMHYCNSAFVGLIAAIDILFLSFGVHPRNQYGYSHEVD